jgi:hypothetical protein
MRNVLLASAAMFNLPMVFMSDHVETVAILRAGSDGQEFPVLINKADYDPKEHGEQFHGNSEYNADGTRRAANPVTPSAPAFTRGNEKTASNTDTGATVHVGNLGVITRGKGKKAKFHVIDQSNGHDVTMEGIDPDGYDDMATAWKAITDIQAKAQTNNEQHPQGGGEPNPDNATQPDGTVKPADDQQNGS